MNPLQLSHQLRQEHNPELDSRRWIIGLSLLGATMGQIVSLYQTGLIDRLPDLPLPFLDSAKVDASRYAYSRFNAPDGPMMVANYAFTAWLASTGGKNRAQETPLLPIAMAAKLIFDALVSAELAREEWAENRAFCQYCQVATLASFASVAIAVPEVLTALRALTAHAPSSR
uniref:Vitamin K epoxide reductase n=1 Tax=Cyanothece sp. (strain PCC 7425 / ATCC 29141) TaxID=395961 RepID=B8HSA7_CYAP4